MIIHALHWDRRLMQDLSAMPGYASAKASVDFMDEQRDLQKKAEERASKIGIWKTIGTIAGYATGLGPLAAAIGGFAGSKIGAATGPKVSGGEFLQESRADITSTEKTKAATDAFMTYIGGHMMQAGGKLFDTTRINPATGVEYTDPGAISSIKGDFTKVTKFGKEAIADPLKRKVQGASLESSLNRAAKEGLTGDFNVQEYLSASTEVPMGDVGYSAPAGSVIDANLEQAISRTYDVPGSVAGDPLAGTSGLERSLSQIYDPSGNVVNQSQYDMIDKSSLPGKYESSYDYLGRSLADQSMMMDEVVVTPAQSSVVDPDSLPVGTTTSDGVTTTKEIIDQSSYDYRDISKMIEGHSIEGDMRSTLYASPEGAFYKGTRAASHGQTMSDLDALSKMQYSPSDSLTTTQAIKQFPEAGIWQGEQYKTLYDEIYPPKKNFLKGLFNRGQ